MFMLYYHDAVFCRSENECVFVDGWVCVCECLCMWIRYHSDWREEEEEEVEDIRFRVCLWVNG